MFVDTEDKNSSMILVTASAGVGLVIVGVIIGLVIGIMCMRRRKQSAQNGMLLFCM